ncbi:MAG: hypothetical protein A2341_13600 [Deltaproteobacteria bacterium RIFOXYB12_FULL_58_9]|nr:MAG: hypothetical protein A2341_13600 [Deltaproteobacteria bacterium RIFOXYB12_FULL_58_9]
MMQSRTELSFILTALMFPSLLVAQEPHTGISDSAGSSSESAGSVGDSAGSVSGSTGSVGESAGTLGDPADGSTEVGPDAFEPTATARLGSLHRAASSLEALIDLYRLSLVEIVVAIERIDEAAKTAAGGPAALLPAPAVEVFGRLNDNVPSRVPTDALSPVARGYHAEVVDSLERLANATRYGEVAEPLEDLVRGLRGVCQSAHAVLDLFSRQRPVHMRMIDPDTMLTNISQALDETAKAEQRIVKLRKKKATLDDHFRAYRRLELSLGHALDLIAVAEEAGLHIGFEMQLSTTGFAELLQQVQSQVDEVEKLHSRMLQPPGPIGGTLSVWLVESEKERKKESEKESDKNVEARLEWNPPQDQPRPSAIRIYRTQNLAGMRERLAAEYRCQGYPAERALVLAGQTLEGVADVAELVAEEAPGRGSFTETWKELPVAPPLYRVVPVSTFAVEGPGIEAVAAHLPRILAGARVIHAKLAATDPSRDNFYEKHDVVTVTWEKSPSDITGSPDRGALAVDQGLPTVAWYRVLRVDRTGDARNVARVPAGTTQYQDRLPLAFLAAGMRYSVEAVAENQDAALPPDACSVSEQVQANMGAALALAKRGLAKVTHPTQTELSARAALADANALETELANWNKKPTDERERLLTTWWAGVPSSQRTKWLQTWSQLFGARERAILMAQPPAIWSARDLQLLQVEAWLADEPPEVRDEVERWWQLSSAAGRDKAIAAWRARANTNHVAAVKAQHTDKEGKTTWGDERTIRVLAWLSSRGEPERAELAEWWWGLPDVERNHRTQKWYASLSEIEQAAVHWPDWHALTDEEKASKMAAPPSPLPLELQRHLHGWRAWQELVEAGGEELAAALETEVGTLPRILARLRFNTRGVDVALGFRLPLVATLAVGLLAMLLWLLRRRHFFDGSVR